MSISLATLFIAACRNDTSKETHNDEPQTQRRGNTQTWFTEITDEVGLEFTHETGGRGDLWLPEITGGAGAALFDYDNDGDLDIYLTSAHAGLPDRLTSRTLTNRLYQQEPSGHFVDVTQASGLGDGGYGMGVAIGDIDNDGRPDVYVTNLGPDRLYRNRGDGTFEDITVAAGIDVDGWSTSASFLDYDRDGFLDLFVTRYVKHHFRRHCTDQAGRREYCSPRAFVPTHDILLHNNGDGTFNDVSPAAGIASVAAAGLGVVCADLNDDGWMDIYVANDAYANNLWINQHDGTFRDDAMILGVAYNLEGQPEAGMGVLAADLDNDLDLDLFVTHLVQETNTLYRNFGAATGFFDVSGESGLAVSSMIHTGFGTAALDIELDGDLDLVVVNGRVKLGLLLSGAEPRPPWDRYAEPNLLYLNDGSGRFTLSEELCGPFCNRMEISRGLAIGDIDADGDLDLLVANAQGRARLYRNDAPRQGHWLMVRAVDPALRRDAIGAKITVRCGERSLLRTINRGFGYLSSNDPIAHFGLGSADRVDWIDVRWPDGLLERFPATPADRRIELFRGNGNAQQ
ncbi:MAG: CRTAC1 family protein [Planctomycetes bacterium]|nr:CRTAC1 family protein [Planctomycetota bacterium]